MGFAFAAAREGEEAQVVRELVAVLAADLRVAAGIEQAGEFLIA
jgi:hypothetical protein